MPFNQHIPAIYPKLPLTLAIAFCGHMAVAEDVVLPSLQYANIDTITILGRTQSPDDIPGSAHVIDREAMERQGYTNPASLLRTLPGVNVAEEEGLGQFPHISMRGVQPERNARITVMEDGLLVASPAPYSAPAAYYFPAIGRMESVEVRKGSSAIKYGPYTVGGALNLISTQIPEQTGGALQYQRGSFNGDRLHAHVGGTQGQWGWLLENYSESSDGFKELDYPTSGRLANKPNNPVPEAGMDRNTSMVKLRWQSPETTSGRNHNLELKYSLDERRVYDSYLGMLAEDFATNPMRRYAGSQADEINTENELFQLRHTLNFSEDTRLVTSVYRSDTTRNWYKLHRVDNGGDGSYVGITQVLQAPEANGEAMAWILGNTELFGADRFTINPDTHGRVRANNRTYSIQGAQLQLSHDFSTGNWDHSLDVGVRYHEDDEDRLQWEDSYQMINATMALVDEQAPGQTTNRLSEADATAVYLQNTLRRENLTLVAGVRYEDITQSRSDWNGTERNADSLSASSPRSNSHDVLIPGLGATYQLTDSWSLLAGYHRGFSPAGNNPNSEPERSDNFEYGARFNQGYARAEVIGFYNDYTNINIECTNVGGGCSDADLGTTKSAGEVLIYGLEASFTYDLGQANSWRHSVPLALSYTWTDSEFQQDIGSDAPSQWEQAREGDAIPEIPKHQLNASIGLAQDRWGLNLNANYTAEAQAFADPALSSLVIEDRLLLDLAGKYKLNPNTTLTASVENLTDETHIVHHRPSGLRPGAPRSVWAGIKVSF